MQKLIIKLTTYVAKCNLVEADQLVIASATSSAGPNQLIID